MLLYQEKAVPRAAWLCWFNDKDLCTKVVVLLVESRASQSGLMASGHIDWLQRASLRHRRRAAYQDFWVTEGLPGF